MAEANHRLPQILDQAQASHYNSGCRAGAAACTRRSQSGVAQARPQGLTLCSPRDHSGSPNNEPGSLQRG
jgi:hypothetical protein